MIGSVEETSSEEFGVGFFPVGAVGQGDPVGVSAKGVGLENPDVYLPEAIVLAAYGYPLLAELGGSGGSGVFHVLNIARFRLKLKGVNRPPVGG